MEKLTFPRYTVTYDVKYVLDYAKECSIFSRTSLGLTSKFLTNMCLLSGYRSQTLVSLSTDCIYLNNSGCVFFYIKVIKNFTSKIPSAANRV